MLFNYRLKIRGKRVHLSRMDRQWTDNGPIMDRLCLGMSLVVSRWSLVVSR